LRAGADGVTVFAAASLKTALDEVADAFEAQGGAPVTVSYAGSSALARQIERGAPAVVETTFQPGETLETTVDHVYPTLDPQTRTLRVRLVVQNPDLRLKPGMFATVIIRAREREDVLAIPSEAVIRSGAREVVFVVRGPGRYEAREITTGLTGARDLVEVTRGLTDGERVVTSGQFLLDSESRLREAAQKMTEVPEAPADPHEAHGP
jgi:Cu(I)/Ag(I) efflux system membrane fusion protein/cobalt-zinc-cadmium efflux system membrane fusion protein